MQPRKNRFLRRSRKRFVLQDRDRLLIWVLFCCGVLTIGMIQALFFSEKNGSRCRRRMRQLLDLGVVDRHFVVIDGTTAVAIYTVGPGGVSIVLDWCATYGIELTAQEARKLSLLPSLSLVRHSLLVAEVYVAFHRWGTGEITMDRWLVEGLIRAQFDVREPRGRRQWRTVVFKPDAAVQLSDGTGRRWTVFIEADRSTEPARQIVTKFQAHSQFLASGQFHALYGEPDFITFVVTTGSLDGRARNLAAIANTVGAHFVVATTLDLLTSQGPLICPCLTADGRLTSLGALLGERTNAHE